MLKPIHLSEELEKLVDAHIPASVIDTVYQLPYFLYGSRSMFLREKMERKYRVIREAAMGYTSKIDWDGTDYDFIIQESKEVRAMLRSRNFTEVDPANLYNVDSTTVGLYLKKVRVGSGREVEVQVILKNDFYLVRKAWMTIDTKYYYKYLWKSSPDFVMKHLDTKDRKEYLTAQFDQIWRTTREAMK